MRDIDLDQLTQVPIESKHHEYLKTAQPRISCLLVKVVSAYAGRHSEFNVL